MREIRTPDGAVWEVFVEWEGRRPLRRSIRRFNQRREARARKRADNKASDLLDGCDAVGGIDELGAAVVLVGVLLLLVVAGPWVLLFLIALAEFGLILALAAVAFAGRTFLRRPWRVVAVDASGELWAWHQVGWFAARALAAETADAMATGRSPSTIVPDQLEAGSPTRIAPDADLGMVASAAVRWTTAGLCIIGLVVVIATAVARLT